MVLLIELFRFKSMYVYISFFSTKSFAFLLYNTFNIMAFISAYGVLEEKSHISKSLEARNPILSKKNVWFDLHIYVKLHKAVPTCFSSHQTQVHLTFFRMTVSFAFQPSHRSVMSKWRGVLAGRWEQSD